MWTAFLNRRWTRERPSRPGKYIVANRAGRVVGEVFVFRDAELGGLAVRIRDGALCTIKELDEPGIWWWSEPMPYLYPEPKPWLTKRLEAITVADRNPAIEVVYVQPVAARDVTNIDFETFAARVERFPDPLSKRLANSLREWITAAGKSAP